MESHFDCRELWSSPLLSHPYSPPATSHGMPLIFYLFNSTTSYLFQYFQKANIFVQLSLIGYIGNTLHARGAIYRYLTQKGWRLRKSWVTWGQVSKTLMFTAFKDLKHYHNAEFSYMVTKGRKNTRSKIWFHVKKYFLIFDKVLRSNACREIP